MTSQHLRANGALRTAIVTGGANGIGAQTVRRFHDRGFNVVVADLPFAQDAAEALISSLSDPSRAVFHPTNVVDWQNMTALFRETKKKFGQVDVVIANAGMMESKGFFDFEEDENGELREDLGSQKVLDVNLNGSMNTLRLAMHSMRTNEPDGDGSRGSVVLIASTSGYFGGTGVVSYITSKHGVVGLARASQRVANQLGVRVNVVAPFFTPTYITGGYSEQWRERGLPANTVENVASAIVATSTDPERTGHSMMGSTIITIAGQFVREIETARTAMTKQWLGEDITDIMAKGGKFFDEMGGYTLPKPRS